MIYYFTYFFTKFLSFLFFPRRVWGIEHMPLKGGFILASNHISNLDPPILGVSTRRRLHFMAKIELFKNPFVGWWLRKLGAYPIKRGGADFGSLKQSLKFLSQGGPVLIFVEGTRRIGNQKPQAQPGVGFLALKSRVPIVPVYLDGSQHVMPKGSKFFKRHLVTVTYGQPFQIPAQMSNEEASQYILRQIYKIAP